MFYFCSSLKYLPDISKWKPEKMQKMIGFFSECSSLISLPNISKWKIIYNNYIPETKFKDIFDELAYKYYSEKEYESMEECGIESFYNNVDVNSTERNTSYIRYMFYNCSSLIYLPDISNWNIDSVNDLSFLFCGCESLVSLPDLSKWNTSKVKNMEYMFFGCSSLLYLPDISKWNINNVTNLSYLFSNCCSLKKLPDISKWKTNNILNVKYLFYNCTSLISLPDISKWNIANLQEFDCIFQNCSSLINFPNINKWNIKDKINIIENDYSCSDSSFKFSKENSVDDNIYSILDSSEKNGNNNYTYTIQKNTYFDDGIEEKNIYYYDNFYD